MGWAAVITMAVIGTILGVRVGRERGRPTLGVTLGFLFGMALAEKPEPRA